MKNQLTPAAILLLVLSIPFYSIANELYPVSLAQRVRNASLIAEGKVTGQQAFADAQGRIFTANRVQVYRLFKGSLAGEEIEIITYGGVLGNRMTVYSSFLSLSVGQSGIFFCMPATVGPGARLAGNTPSYEVYSSMQGFIEYDTKQLHASDPFNHYSSINLAAGTIRQLTHQETRLRDHPDLMVKETTMLGITAVPTIDGLSPTTIAAGTGSVLTISGTNFGSTPGTVEFRNANNGGASWIQANSWDIVSWSDNEVRVVVPSYSTSKEPAGTGQVRVTNASAETAVSTASITVPYARINVFYSGATYGAAHVNTNSAGGYTFQMENGFATSAAANASFRRALQTWTCKTGMNWMVGSNTTVTALGDDNVNVVQFNALPAGVLGVCTSYYNGCLGPSVTWFVTGFDVTFSNTANWEYGPTAPVSPKIDFESVAVHELGHAQQLTHIINFGAVMHYGIGPGMKARDLGAGDINGGNLITSNGFASPTCGKPAMQPGTVYALSGVQGSSQVCLTQMVAAGGTTFNDGSCGAIARVVPSGSTPVSGSVDACVKYESGIPSFNGQPFGERHFEIAPASGGATATATITLYFSQAEFNNFNAGNGAFPDLPTSASDATGIANLRVSQYKGTSATGLPGSYSGSTTVIDPDDAQIVWNTTAARWEVSFDVNGFSGFYVHTSASSALPIRLVQFSGSIQGDRNLLQWTVAGDEPVAYFEVQRSTDGRQFHTAGQVGGTGSTATQNAYQYVDDAGKMYQPVLYYRLRIVGSNGRETLGQVITLRRNYTVFGADVLQNPFSTQLQVSIHSPKAQSADLLLTDMNGRVLARQPVSLPNGQRILPVAATRPLNSGTYLLTIVTAAERVVLKVVKQ